MTIWMRYLGKQLGQIFAFLFFCLFIVYFLVDFSINGVRFLSIGTTDILELFLYYMRHLSMHLDLFFSLSLLLSCLKVLNDLNQHHELVALQMAGISRKKLLFPFYILAATLSCLSYANAQWFAPHAQDAIEDFQRAHAKKKKKIAQEHVHSISLNDRSELVYQSIHGQTLFDAFWIRSVDDIWHIKRLELTDPPLGHFVDHLVRGKDKQFQKTDSFDQYVFPQLSWPEEVSLYRFIPFENRPLTLLAHQALSQSADQSKIFAHLNYKLALPLLPFLVLFAIAPVTMRFSRQKPLFLIAACCLFGFISLMTLLEGLLILGENQVFPPYLATWGPLAIAFALVARPFAKL